jgi:hypothetical protein
MATVGCLFDVDIALRSLFSICNSTRRKDVGDEESDEGVTHSLFEATRPKERRRKQTQGLRKV